MENNFDSELQIICNKYNKPKGVFLELDENEYPIFTLTCFHNSSILKIIPHGETNTEVLKLIITSLYNSFCMKGVDDESKIL